MKISKVIYKRTPESVYEEFCASSSYSATVIAVCDGIIVEGRYYGNSNYHYILDEEDSRPYNCNWNSVAEALNDFYNRDKSQFNEIIASVDKNTDEYKELKSAVENYAKTRKPELEELAKQQARQAELTKAQADKVEKFASEV